MNHARLATFSLGLALAVGAACTPTETTEPTTEPQELGTIAEIAAENEDLETLYAALEAANLVDTLNEDGPFTVFAPTDEAFADLPEGTVESLLEPANIDALTDILLYHVVDGSVMAEQVITLQSAETIQGAEVTVTVDNGDVFINDAQVVITDIEADNGIIHVIDTVLLPPPDLSPIAQTLTDDGRFSTLLAAASAAGLAGALTDGGPFTIFAPTDAAFADLPPGTVESLLEPENIDTLTSILQYHLVDGAVESGTVVGVDSVTTVQGEEVTVEVVGGEVVLNGSATVIEVDIQSENGVIHVIDTVLLPPAPPPSIAGWLVEDGRFSTLLAAATAAGLDGALDTDGPFTLFAPTDAAFGELPPGTVETLLEPENIDDLTTILQYHLIQGELNSSAVVALGDVPTAAGVEFEVTVDGSDVLINGSAQIIEVDYQGANGLIHVIDEVLIP